jgi:hypothetical protein
MNIIDKLSESLPVAFPRKDVGKLTGGIISSKYLSNCDSIGQGPKDRCIVAGKVCYDRASFLEWLASKIRQPAILPSRLDSQDVDSSRSDV